MIYVNILYPNVEVSLYSWDNPTVLRSIIFNTVFGSI